MMLRNHKIKQEKTSKMDHSQMSHNDINHDMMNKGNGGGGHHHVFSKEKIKKSFWIKSTVLICIFVYFILINVVRPDGPIKYTWHYGIWFPLASYVVFWEGRSYFKIYKKAIKGVFDMYTLIGLAVHIMYVFSISMALINLASDMYTYPQMWEGVGILVLVTNIGDRLGDQIRNSSLDAYEKLNSIKKSVVDVIRDNKEMSIPVEQVNIGDIIIVPRGEMVPLDGKIINDGVFDYSNITGESKKLSLKSGQEVVSGSFNLSDVVKIKVTSVYKHSTINKIVESIENVSSIRPKMQVFADKILRYFVPVVMFLSLITFIVWITVGYTTDFTVPWPAMNKDMPGYIISLSAGVTVLAIACPCALGIATPLIYAVSSLLSSENGIVINDPKALEEMRNIKIIAFDKTGTITNEDFEISSVEGNEKLIGIAKSLEKNIKHPIAKAILSLPGAFATGVTGIKAVDNKGVVGKYKNHKVEMKKVDDDSATTNVGLYVDNKVKLIFKLNNIIKSGVKETIKDLKDKGIKVVMITGDNEKVANHIASQVGIDNVYSNVTPNDKASIIQKLQKEGKVGFVGDGFNDAVAMKQSNVSIAFATGSDITNSLSDISIMNNDFQTIDKLFVISKSNNFNVKLSLLYAFALNVIAIPLAMLILVPIWIAAILMAVSNILVVSNSYVYKVRGRKKLNNKK